MNNKIITVLTSLIFLCSSNVNAEQNHWAQDQYVYDIPLSVSNNLSELGSGIEHYQELMESLI